MPCPWVGGGINHRRTTYSHQPLAVALDAVAVVAVVVAVAVAVVVVVAVAVVVVANVTAVVVACYALSLRTRCFASSWLAPSPHLH